MLRRGQDTLEAVRIAVGAIRANTARGVLTTLGIVIGVLGVITTMTAANGLANNFRESVSALGTDVVYVSRMPWIIRGNFFEFRNRPRMSLREVEGLESRLPHAAAINPTTHTERSVKYASETIENIDIIGTTDKQMLVSTSVPEVGRFLTSFDVQANRRVCVIGSEIRTRLFGDVDPLNKQMKVGRATFRVIGVMEKQGSAGFFGGPDFDSQVFVPITTFAKTFGGAQRNIDIAVKAPPTMPVADFEYEVIGEMRKLRKLAPGDKENFSINKMDSLLEMFNNVMGVVLLIGIVITGISLFVGGVGCDEHHVRLGHRAYARDRNPQGDRRQEALDPRPIPLRVGSDLPHRRPHGPAARRGRHRDHQPHADAGEHLSGNRRRRPAGLDGNRHRRRRRPGLPGIASRSDRRAALRMSP